MVPFSRIRSLDTDRPLDREEPPGFIPKPDAANVNVTLRPASLVIVGNLAPQSVAADLLECAIFLAEAVPWRPLNIDWIGDGALCGLLRAQTLPDALRQRFHGALPPHETARRMARADVLCSSGPISDLGQPLEPPAWAGVPIIGCADDADLVTLLGRGQIGWTFDRASPISMMTALARALEVDAVANATLVVAPGRIATGTLS